MIIGGTLIVLVLWMAFIWLVDPDGMLARDGRHERVHAVRERLRAAARGED